MLSFASTGGSGCGRVASRLATIRIRRTEVATLSHAPAHLTLACSVSRDGAQCDAKRASRRHDSDECRGCLLLCILCVSSAFQRPGYPLAADSLNRHTSPNLHGYSLGRTFHARCSGRRPTGPREYSAATNSHPPPTSPGSTSAVCYTRRTALPAASARWPRASVGSHRHRCGRPWDVAGQVGKGCPAASGASGGGGATNLSDESTWPRR